jgi:Rha family phage regulatory protein
MNALALTAAPALKIVNGQPTTTSVDVANFFHQRHANVIRAIENLSANPEVDPLRNFAQGSFTLPETGNQQHRMYTITRKGFVLLAMGFTGKRALAFKISYIDAFDAMESALRQPAGLSHTITPEQAGELATRIAERFPDGREFSNYMTKVEAFAAERQSCLPACTSSMAGTGTSKKQVACALERLLRSPR